VSNAGLMWYIYPRWQGLTGRPPLKKWEQSSTSPSPTGQISSSL